jgi:hypothetical protein
MFIFTPDGWFSGTNQPRGFVRMFDGSGAALPDGDVVLRRSSSRVIAALGGAQG